MMFANYLTGVAGLCLASFLSAQDPAPPASPQDRAEAMKALLKSLREEGVDVDLKAETVTIDAVVNPPTDGLEYLLIHRRGKSHEAMFVTDAKPSLLNSGLMMLGYEKGKNATYKPIDPPPTEAEVAAGADWVEVFPPEGMPLHITASWKSEDGKSKTYLCEDLLIDLTTSKPVVELEWIFLGGRMAAMYRGEPPVFMADFEGNLVSVCYLAPENHLATMKHARARDDQNWWLSKLCPPPGTKVKLRLHKNKPDLERVPLAVIERAGEESANKDGKDGKDDKGEGR